MVLSSDIGVSRQIGEGVRTGEFKELAAGVRNADAPPFAHRRAFDFAQGRDGTGATEAVDDRGIGVKLGLVFHERMIGAPTNLSIGQPIGPFRRLPYMEPWARRIEKRMLERGETIASLARACKVKSASVSGWYGRGAKPTQMIIGDNLVAAAAFLHTTAEWIMTGKGVEDLSVGQSHAARLDRHKVAVTTKALLRFLRRRDPKATLDLSDPEDAELFASVYEEAIAMPSDPTDEDQQEFGVKVASLIERRSEQGHERVRSQQAGGNPGEKIRRTGAGSKT